MNKLLFLFLAFFICLTIYGQNYEVPKDYKFGSEEACASYEPQIKETIDWLLQTPLGKDAIKRQEANAFLLSWTTETPAVSIGLDSRIINFTKDNPELLIPFVAGWIKYSLENDYSKDIILGNKAGVETVVAFYQKNRGYLKKNGNIDKYNKLIEKNKLEEEIKKKLNK